MRSIIASCQCSCSHSYSLEGGGSVLINKASTRPSSHAVFKRHLLPVYVDLSKEVSAAFSSSVMREVLRQAHFAES